MSVNSADKVLVLVNIKCRADGTVMKKIEKFSESGVARCFSKDGEEIATVNPRLNRVHDSQDWLSMRPDPLSWYTKSWNTDLYDETLFGEVVEQGIPHGRGIKIYEGGDIVIGYW